MRVKMALVNARSAVNKTFILNDFFTSRSLDFLFVTETWFTAGDVSPFSELLPGNCTFFNSPQTVRRGGGLATNFKENFSCQALKTDAYNSFELQLLALGSVNPLVIALIYRPPKPHKDFLADFSAFLSGIIPNFDRFLIFGDFVCCPRNLLAKDFISLIDSFNLVQLVKSPTHSHGHTLDLVLFRGFSVLDIEVGDCSFSDHKPILFTVPLSSPVVKSCKPACMTRIKSSTTRDTFSLMFNEFSQSLVPFYTLFI